MKLSQTRSDSFLNFEINLLSWFDTMKPMPQCVKFQKAFIFKVVVIT